MHILVHVAALPIRAAGSVPFTALIGTARPATLFYARRSTFACFFPLNLPRFHSSRRYITTQHGSAGRGGTDQTQSNSRLYFYGFPKPLPTDHRGFVDKTAVIPAQIPAISFYASTFHAAPFSS